MTRVVFDTNVTIGALLFTDSVPGRAFIRAMDHGTILVSVINPFESWFLAKRPCASLNLRT